MTAPASSFFQVLKTKRFILRQMTLDDDQEIFRLRSDKEILKYQDIEKAMSVEEARQFIININYSIQRNELFYWAISENIDSRLMGTICLWNFGPDELKADIGFALLKEYQGLGIMQEVIPSVLFYGFNVLNLDKIDGETDPENIKSIKLMERFGFRHCRKLEKTDIYSLSKTGYLSDRR